MSEGADKNEGGSLPRNASDSNLPVSTPVKHRRLAKTRSSARSRSRKNSQTEKYLSPHRGARKSLSMSRNSMDSKLRSRGKTLAPHSSSAGDGLLLSSGGGHSRATTEPGLQNHTRSESAGSVEGGRVSLSHSHLAGDFEYQELSDGGIGAPLELRLDIEDSVLQDVATPSANIPRLEVSVSMGEEDAKRLYPSQSSQPTKSPTASPPKVSASASGSNTQSSTSYSQSPSPSPNNSKEMKPSPSNSMQKSILKPSPSASHDRSKPKPSPSGSPQRSRKTVRMHESVLKSPKSKKLSKRQSSMKSPKSKKLGRRRSSKRLRSRNSSANRSKRLRSRDSSMRRKVYGDSAKTPKNANSIMAALNFTIDTDELGALKEDDLLLTPTTSEGEFSSSSGTGSGSAQRSDRSNHSQSDRSDGDRPADGAVATESKNDGDAKTLTEAVRRAQNSSRTSSRRNVFSIRMGSERSTSEVVPERPNSERPAAKTLGAPAGVFQVDFENVGATEFSETDSSQEFDLVFSKKKRVIKMKAADQETSLSRRSSSRSGSRRSSALRTSSRSSKGRPRSRSSAVRPSSRLRVRASSISSTSSNSQGTRPRSSRIMYEPSGRLLSERPSSSQGIAAAQHESQEAADGGSVRSAKLGEESELEVQIAPDDFDSLDARMITPEAHMDLLTSDARTTKGSVKKRFDWNTQEEEKEDTNIKGISDDLRRELTVLDGFEVIRKDKEVLTQEFLERLAAAEKHRRAEDIFQVGRCYNEGIGVPRDFVQALFWYEQAAEMKYAPAINNLGLCHVRGHSVPVNAKKGLKFLTEAATLGHTIAMFNVGMCFLEGRGCKPRQYANAFTWFRKAGMMGHDDSQVCLGMLFLHYDRHKKAVGRSGTQSFHSAVESIIAATRKSGGKKYEEKHPEELHLWDGVPFQPETAARFFVQAAKQGHTVAQHNVGILCLMGCGVEKRPETAFRWFTRAASVGHGPSCDSLAYMWYHGIGCQQSFHMAAKWWRKSLRVADNSPDALISLGLLYLRGYGVTKNEERALEYFEVAASEFEDLRGMTNAASCIIQGIGTEKSVVRAMPFLLNAIKKGCLFSTYNLARLLLKGLLRQDEAFSASQMLELQESKSQAESPGFDVDILLSPRTRKDMSRKINELRGRGLAYLRQAAEAGFAKAQGFLGYVLMTGFYNCPKNMKEGVQWIRKGAINGDLESCRNLASCYEHGKGGLPLDPQAAMLWYNHFKKNLKNTEKQLAKDTKLAQEEHISAYNFKYRSSYRADESEEDSASSA